MKDETKGGLFFLTISLPPLAVVILMLFGLLSLRVRGATFPRYSVIVDTNHVLLAPSDLFAANSNALNAALPFVVNPLSTNTPSGVTNVVKGIVAVQTNDLNTALTNLVLVATNALNTALTNKILNATNDLKTAVVGFTNDLNTALTNKILNATNNLEIALVAYADAATNALNTALTNKLLSATNDLNSVDIARYGWITGTNTWTGTNKFTGTNNTFAGASFTNRGLVWLATNLATGVDPNAVLPNGSILTATNGAFYVRSNDAWVLK